eukprot:CAMPEP_0197828272 /NCGR_PEP_ID=MMETSP1437-20131217/4881_1 /TAXON_ID=49252 ORGANISM="Eucampia antarctica, Strain CCMP1452" /NCGR_SAMPLE_ID=MMETSP1437 /ASSEMBLY_ACC=CAM_ASM_001096 /LENGTH=236 /DNA_ID=CAMNT_0043429441 /DNA_START=113 /DNA_END=826 /DNA_ORIENTATION=+
MSLALLFVVVSCVWHSSNAWSIANNNNNSNRRAWLKETAVTVAAVLLPVAPAVAVVGEDDNNEFIQQLKKRSDEKRDVYKKEATRSDKMSVSQFSKQYKKPRYIGIRLSQNDASSVTMIPSDVFNEMMANKQLVVYDFQLAKKKDGSNYEDYTSKIYVFANDDAVAFAKAGGKQPSKAPPAPVESVVVAEPVATESAAVVETPAAPAIVVETPPAIVVVEAPPAAAVVVVEAPASP